MQSETFFSPFADENWYHISPGTKAAAHMFLCDDAKTFLHDNHGGVRRETQPVKAGVRCWKVIIRFCGLVNVKSRSQTPEALNWKMLHRGPKEEENLFLIW